MRWSISGRTVAASTSALGSDLGHHAQKPPRPPPQIDDRWVAALAGETIQVIDPCSAQSFGTIARGRAEETVLGRGPLSAYKSIDQDTDCGTGQFSRNEPHRTPGCDPGKGVAEHAPEGGGREMRVASNRVFVDKEHASHVVLPLIRRT